MSKFIVLGLCMTSLLSAWEDHPDRDEDRRNAGADSKCAVGGGYDWSARDRDSRDHDGPENEPQGTIDRSGDSKD